MVEVNLASVIDADFVEPRRALNGRVNAEGVAVAGPVYCLVKGAEVANNILRISWFRVHG